MRGLGSAHVDHRLRQLDFADNAYAKAFASPVASLDKVKSALLVGSVAVRLVRVGRWPVTVVP